MKVDVVKPRGKVKNRKKFERDTHSLVILGSVIKHIFFNSSIRTVLLVVNQSRKFIFPAFNDGVKRQVVNSTTVVSEPTSCDLISRGKTQPSPNTSLQQEQQEGSII